MRVAFVACSAPARTAVGNLLAEKSAFFVDRGAEVRVFLESTASLHPSLLPHVQNAPFPVDTPTWNFLANSDLVFFEVSQGFDLLGLLPLLVDEKPRLIATYYGISPSRDWPGPQREILERGERQRGLLWCADAVVVHSRFTRNELTIATSIPADRFQQLPIPLDLARWLPNSGDRRNGNPVLLFVGRLAVNKRLPLVIEALAHLTNAEAWIVGNDRDVYADQARRARELAERLGVEKRVRWLGDVADDALPTLYHRADVLVLPSIHEGLGIPVLEAQAAGLPVVAARAAALPETIADAGLTFRPDDVNDFVRQLRRVLSPSTPTSAPKKRVALVAFRFGAGFVGGAETSLRNLGRALMNQGYDVEAFTTCTIREYDWQNDLPAGDTLEDGLLVHRFPIDPHDRARHDDAFRTILEKNGEVSPEVEAAYLEHSIKSSSLLDALSKRRDDFDAIVVGPYLHGLTCRVAREFPDKSLLLGCFHDEPLARLRLWQDVYGSIAGILFHAPEEQAFVQETLGINTPGNVLIGACLPIPKVHAAPPPSPPVRRGRGVGGAGAEPTGDIAAIATDATPLTPTLSPGVPGEREQIVRTLVYCGRYSIQKNVPMLLDWARRYQTDHPDRFRWRFIGEGNQRPPAEPWIEDLGRISDDEKRQIVAQASALVQLSTCESLSLVVLEAWQHGTPVIVHEDCEVLAGQLDRSGGGLAVGDYDAFAHGLDDFWTRPDEWSERGQKGQNYVRDNYLDETVYARRLIGCLDQLRLPLAERMRRRGLDRAQNWSRPAWREQFGRFVEQLLDAPPRVPRRDLVLEPLVAELGASARQASLLLPLRIHNRGNVPAEPLTTRLTMRWAVGREDVANSDASDLASFPLTDLILPGKSSTILVPIDLPNRSETMTLTLQIIGSSPLVALPVEIGAGTAFQGGVTPLLDAAELAVAQAHARQALPRDYVDVCEGRFARWKRIVKQKLLNNFKRAYVDVLSSQQSEVNRRLVESVQQLTECCRALDQTVRVLQDRVSELSREKRDNSWDGSPTRPEASATKSKSPSPDETSRKPVPQESINSR